MLFSSALERFSDTFDDIAFVIADAAGLRRLHYFH